MAPVVAAPRSAVARLLLFGGYLDAALAAVLGAAALVVHNVGYMLTLPFWTDEAWVAISTRLPLHLLIRVTSSTPAGWTLLLRFVVVGGQQRLRMVPLVFSALTVVAAYAYVRSLPWPRVFLGRLAAVLAAVAALLLPSALARDDLKQYTADAFATLLILLLASRLESAWSRKRLVTLGAVVAFGFIFSAVSAFVGAAALGSALLVLLIRRRWRDARDTALVGVCAGVLLLGIFLTLYRPGIPPGLTSYWAADYLPVHQGWIAGWNFLLAGGHRMASYLGMGPLAVAVLLVAGGVVTLVRLRRVALAVTVPALFIEMVVLGALDEYPLFDLRTSHFLTTALGVTAAIGVAGMCALLSRVHVGVATATAAVAALLFVGNVKHDIRAAVINMPSTSPEDLRTPIAYLAAHQRPDDIIVVNMSSNWGFAYYWPTGVPAIEPVTANLQRFVTVFPDQPHILVATDRTLPAIDAIMNEAVAAAAKLGPGARIWVIHQHMITAERIEFDAYPQAHGLTSTTVMAGSLVLVTPPAAGWPHSAP